MTDTTMTKTATGFAFQEERPYLFAVAYRMTGSASDAEDLVQDAWIRFYEAGQPGVTSIRAYLTRIVSHLALDYLKSARVQREAYPGPWMPDPVLTESALPGPAETVEQREQVSIALLTLLEQLTPEQRVVFVLREGFGVPYNEIAEHIGQSASTCRQLYHRSRTRLAADRPHTVVSPDIHREMIDCLMVAVNTGRVADVVLLLSQDARWTGDGGPDRLATRRPVVGVDRVARGLCGLAKKIIAGGFRPTMTPVDLNGAPGIAVHLNGRLERVIVIDVEDGQIAHVRMMLNPDKLRHLEAQLGMNSDCRR